MAAVAADSGAACAAPAGCVPGGRFTGNSFFVAGTGGDCCVVVRTWSALPLPLASSLLDRGGPGGSGTHGGAVASWLGRFLGRAFSSTLAALAGGSPMSLEDSVCDNNMAMHLHKIDNHIGLYVLKNEKMRK